MTIESPKIITQEWEEMVFGVKHGEEGLSIALHEMIDGLIEEEFGPDFFCVKNLISALIDLLRN